MSKLGRNTVPSGRGNARLDERVGIQGEEGVRVQPVEANLGEATWKREAKYEKWEEMLLSKQS